MSSSEPQPQPEPAAPPSTDASTPPNQMSPLVPLVFFGVFLVALIAYGALGN